MNKNNNFEKDLLKRYIRDNYRLDEIEAEQLEIEKKENSANLSNEQKEALRIKHITLQIQARLIEAVFETDENLSSNFVMKDSFVVFRYGYIKDEKKYNKDAIYRGRCLLTDGFHRAIELSGLTEELIEFENNIEDTLLLKAIEKGYIASTAREYRIFILESLKQGFGIEEAIEDSIRKYEVILKKKELK